MNKKKAVQYAGIAADATAITAGTVIRTVLKVFATGLLILLTTGLLFACIFAYYVKTSISTDLGITLEDYSVAQSSIIWYQDSAGNYKQLTTLYSEKNSIWVEYDEIPEHLVNATIAIEDQRFRTHKGVDWYRTVAAFANMFLEMKSDFGGSTITQQLIKNLTLEDDVTVQRKLLEIFQALELEKTYTKNPIIEWYLNIIYLGENCYGVATAAETYFDKDISDLTLAECASIVAITNNPSLYDPFISETNNKKRQEIILYEMYDQDMISYEEYIGAVNQKLPLVRGEDDEYVYEINSYYVEAVISDVIDALQKEKGISYQAAEKLVYSGGYQIYACIDVDIQAIVDALYQDTDQLPQSYRVSNQQLQSAMVIMDPYSGDIVALAGGVGEKTANLILNRATKTVRPPGSSIKPISVYGPAFEYGLITQYTLVDDSPDIVLEGTSWYPRNSGGGNERIITIRRAVQQSLNTVAAQVVDKLTPQASYDYLKNRLGVTSLVDGDSSYAPMALGQLTNGISVREIAQAYTSFVNDGVLTFARTFTKVTDSEGGIILDNPTASQVAFSANTAWNITDMLKNAAQYGTGYEAYFSSTAVAGKTGTTTDNCDRWFVGYTAYYVGAVWTGYDMPETMYFNGNPAAQIWKTIMQAVHADLEYASFPTPSIGSPTNIFGDLSEEDEDEDPDESESPSETPSEDPSEAPVESPSEVVSPPVSHAPEVSEPPVVSDELFPSDTDNDN